MCADHVIVQGKSKVCLYDGFQCLADLVCGVNNFHEFSAMDCSVSEKQKLASVQLAADKASGDTPVANNVLVPVTSMFSKLALDKVGAHHVITHLVSFETYKLPPGEWELHPSDDGSDTVVFGVQLGCEQKAVRRHDGLRHNRLRLHQVGDVPVVGIPATNTSQIGTGAFRSPLEWAIVHRFRGK